jgi:hypothetical protein
MCLARVPRAGIACLFLALLGFYTQHFHRDELRVRMRGCLYAFLQAILGRPRDLGRLTRVY